MARNCSFHYRVNWRRIGSTEMFGHDVIACSVAEAFAASRAELRKALGPNLDLWESVSAEEMSPVIAGLPGS
jgi:hypothetical protein